MGAYLKDTVISISVPLSDPNSTFLRQVACYTNSSMQGGYSGLRLRGFESLLLHSPTGQL